MKIAITGAQGFLAKHLARYFSTHGFQVAGLSRTKFSDLSAYREIRTLPAYDESELRNAWEALRPDFILHTASSALSGRDLYAIDSEFDVSVRLAANVARTVPDWVKATLYFGSCEEYGNGEPPFRETDQAKCFSPYGWGKIAAYYAVQFIAQQRRSPWIWLRPFLCYGEGQRSKLFIPSLIEACLKDQPIDLTPCGQTRDFLYVGDLCRMAERILNAPEKVSGGPINLCTGQPLPLRFVAEKIQAISNGGRLNFGALPYRANEAISFFGSPELFLKTYGPMELTRFDEAISRTVSAARKLL